MSKYKLSVIIPVYNVENYIAKCLDSVLSQADDTIEIICVNDESPDNSRAIVERYMKEYPQLICIDQKNGGLSAARNTGIRAARGEYIVLLDSDDWLDNDVLFKLYHTAKSKDVDVLLGNVKWIYPDKIYTEKANTADVITEVMTGKQALEALMSREVYVPMAYNSICKRSFLVENELWFKDGLIYEDELWTPQVLFKADRVYASDIYHYNYLQRDNTITTSKGNQKKIDSFFYISQQLIEMSKYTDNQLLKEQLWFRAVVLYHRGYKMHQLIHPKESTSFKITWRDLKDAKLSYEIFNKSLGFLDYNKRQRRYVRLIIKLC